MNPLTRIAKNIPDGWIKGITYTRLPSGTAIVCEITLYSLHVVHGIACMGDMDNYDEVRGTQAAYDKAVVKVLELVAFCLHEKMHTQAIPNRHAELVNNYQYPATKPTGVSHDQTKNQGA